jgi:hypothetical protein
MGRDEPTAAGSKATGECGSSRFSPAGHAVVGSFGRLGCSAGAEVSAFEQPRPTPGGRKQNDDPQDHGVNGLAFGDGSTPRDRTASSGGQPCRRPV